MKRKIGKSIFLLITALAIVVIAVFFLTSLNKSSQLNKSGSRSTSKNHISKSSSSSVSTSSSSSSSSSSTVSSSSAQQRWESLDLVHQIAILIQAAFPNQNGHPNSQFDFASNYWDMTGAVYDGIINRYVPKADGFAGISDILSAKIHIDGQGQIHITRPITDVFVTSLDQALADYYTQPDAIAETDRPSTHVVNPAKLAELQKNH